MSIKTLTLAMTGASGAPYTIGLMRYCLQQNIQIQFLCSTPGQIVMGMESDLKLSGTTQKIQARLAEYFDGGNSEAIPGGCPRGGLDQTGRVAPVDHDRTGRKCPRFLQS